MPQDNQGPLSGTRVLDFTTMLSGPLATMLLGDQGADIIKVEHPTSGDYTRAIGTRKPGTSSMFINNNRNKRSIAIDLKSNGGKTAVEDIVRSSDVLVENFRPGVMDRLGLGYDEMQKINPAIIYVSISGFGQHGPWVNKPTYDPLVQATSGLTTIQAGSNQERPRLVRTIIADKVTALTVSQAISAALLYRCKTGVGQRVNVSMADALRQFLWASDMNAHTFIADESVPDASEDKASFVDLIYEVRDGFVTISVMTDVQWAALCGVLGREDWISDERFRTASLREQNVDQRLTLTQAEVAARNKDDLLAQLEAAHVPCAPVLNRQESFEHPQAIATDATLVIDHPSLGQIRQSRHAAIFSKSPIGHDQLAPFLGEDGLDVLRDVGLTDEQIRALVAAKAVTLPGKAFSA